MILSIGRRVTRTSLKTLYGPCVNNERHNMYVPKRKQYAVCSKCGLKLSEPATEMWAQLHHGNQTIRFSSNPKKYGKNQKLAVRIRDRDGDDCFYCRKELSDDTRTIDHYIPLAGDGGTGIENLRLSCCQCNRKKRAIPGPVWELLLAAGVCDNCFKHWTAAQPVQVCCEEKLQSYSKR